MYKLALHPHFGSKKIHRYKTQSLKLLEESKLENTCKNLIKIEFKIDQLICKIFNGKMSEFSVFLGLFLKFEGIW